MARSISEFIQESENCVATPGTDNFVKMYAETAAAISLAQCYTEQAMIMEFAAENGIDSLRIVQEADEEKKDNIFKRAGGAIKGAWGKFIEFIKGILTKIKNAFVNQKAKAMAKKLTTLDPMDEIKISTHILLPSILASMNVTLGREIAELAKDFKTSDVKPLAESITKMADTLNDFAAGRVTSMKALLYEYMDGDELDDIDIDHAENGKITLTVGTVQKLLSDAKLNKVDKMTEEAKRSLTNAKDAIEKGTSDDDFVNGESIHFKALSDAMGKYTTSLTKCSEMVIKYMNRIETDMNEALEKAKKKLPETDQPKTTTESFYFV